jgi:FkbM family methyltransferase
MKFIRQFFVNIYMAITALVPRSWVAEMFRISGELLGVKSITCHGRLGAYEAQLNDRGILGYYLIHHTWEPGIQKLLLALAKPGKGSFIDVGANVGLTLVPMGVAYPELKLIGIEADRENFGYLRRNLDRNELSGVALHNLAVYSREGELEFERSDRNAGDHRVHGVGDKDMYGESKRQVTRVKCSRVDTLFDVASLPAPIGMKCDVQGAEVHFFRGGDAVLQAVEYLVVEYWPYGISRAGSQPKKFFEILARHFPYGGIVDSESLSPPRLVPIAELEIAVASRLRLEGETAHCDLLFSKVVNRLPVSPSAIQ